MTDDLTSTTMSTTNQWCDIRDHARRMADTIIEAKNNGLLEAQPNGEVVGYIEISPKTYEALTNLIPYALDRLVDLHDALDSLVDPHI